MFGKTNRAVFFDVAKDDGILPFATAIVEAPRYASDVDRTLSKEWDESEGAQNRIVWRSNNLIAKKRGRMEYYDFDPLIHTLEKIGNLTFFIDESHQVCDAWNSTNGFLKLIRMGRHYGINIVWISQRFATVSRELTANTDALILFRLREPLDIQAIRNRCGEEVAHRVQNLRRIETVNGKIVPGQHIDFDLNSGKWTVST